MFKAQIACGSKDKMLTVVIADVTAKMMRIIAVMIPAKKAHLVGACTSREIVVVADVDVAQMVAYLPMPGAGGGAPREIVAETSYDSIIFVFPLSMLLSRGSVEELSFQVDSQHSKF